MSTKYELQAELRDLNRGMKALPISKMKKHELEHAIDSMRKLKVEKASTPMPPPAKGGRPVSRPVTQSESIEDDGTVLHVPVAPRVRQVEHRTPKKVAAKPDGADLFPAHTKAMAVPPLKAAGKARAAPAPPKLEPDSDEEMAKKVKKHTHACNCDKCPHGPLVNFA